MAGSFGAKGPFSLSLKIPITLKANSPGWRSRLNVTYLSVLYGDLENVPEVEFFLWTKKIGRGLEKRQFIGYLSPRFTTNVVSITI